MASFIRAVLVFTACLATVAGARVEAQAKHGKRPGGPAPYGYYRTAGEAVPDWRPEHIGQRSTGAKLDWYFLGARPIVDEYWSGNDDASGRVATIAVDPTDANVAYAGAASGGLWKTTDGGATWTPLTDQLPNLNSGWVAIDPTDQLTIYYGTGEYATGASGDGLFRSLDGGATWTKIATTAQVGNAVSRIIVDPTEPMIIHVAGNGGVTRSTNGGATWSARQLANVSDLVVDASNPKVLYCGQRDVGVHKSIDGGETWTQLGGGLPTTNVRRINLAISASNPKVVYAGIVNSSNGLRGFYRTGDGGTSWTQMTNTPNYPSPQGWYDHFVACSPTDENLVFAGGVFPSYAPAGVIRSTSGGASWTDVTRPPGGGQLHPDQHCLVFGPDGTIWVGNDGGVWKSTNLGASWINCNATLAVTQNYQISLHPTDPEQVIGGTQDNGTIGRFDDSLVWPQIIGGDGGFSYIDRDEPYRTYTTYVRLTIFRFVNGFFDAEITGPWAGVDTIGFIAPLVADPNDAKVLLGGTNRLWRTLDARASSVTWTAISDTTIGGGGVLSAIAVAPGASNTICTGSTNGRCYFTSNGVNWFNRSTGLPTSAIGDIVVDPANPQHVFLASYATSGGRVFETTNAGVTWTSRTATLPTGLSGRALAVDWRTRPPRLFLGTGVGVYASYDGGTSWVKDSLNLPNVNIGDLAIDTVRETLTVGTYGRGAWRTPLPCLPGDVDFDGVVNADDVPGFVGVLVNGAANADLLCAADVNDNGAADGDDIQPMVGLLIGP